MVLSLSKKTTAIYICALIFVLSTVNSKETQRIYMDDLENSHQLQILTKKLNDQSSYGITVNQQLLLDYEVDLNAYSIDLQEITDDGLKPLQTVNRNDQEGQDATQIDTSIPNGCTSYRRDFFIKKEEDFEGNQDQYITDLIVLPANKKIYVLTSNFEIIPGTFNLFLDEFGEKTIETEFQDGISYFSDLVKISGNNDLQSTNTFGFITDSEDYAFVITKYGSIKFDTRVDFTDKNFKFQENTFYPQKEIKEIVSYHQYVFVLLGQDGLNIYEVQDGNLTLRTQLLPELLKNSSTQNIDISKIVINSEVLAVLDKENGIFFYDCRDVKNVKKLNMELKLQNIESFDYRGNTMIIIFGGRADKVWEIFLNYNSSEYFVNRVYVDDITYNDVRIDRYFAILISDSAHRIIAHSIYKGFSESSLWQRHRYFTQLSLDFMVILNYVEESDTFFVQKRSYDVQNTLDIHKTSFLVATGGNRFSIHQMQQFHTQIRCTADRPMEVNYQVTIKSSNCEDQQSNLDPSKQLGNGILKGDQYSKNIIDPYIQCRRQFNMTFTARSDLIESANFNLVVAIYFGVIMFLIFIGCFIFYSYRLAKQQREAAQQRWHDIQQKHKDNFEEQGSENQSQPQQQQQQQQQEQQINQQQQQQQPGNGSNFQIDDDEDDE